METKQIISWLYDKAARAQDHSYARMLNMTAKRLKELDEKQRWIPVTERLPDDFSENLCRVIRPIPGGKYVRETKVLWCDYDKSWSCEGLIVTHWMPLPEPPKGE